MTDFDIAPAFLDSPQGRIFVIHRYPHAQHVRQGVVLIPPFAEEMNCSRRMLTLLAEALAVNGCHVVLPDFFGTGDSEGEFSEASWCGWLEQLGCCVEDLQTTYAIEHYSVVAVRAGALLAADYIEQSHHKPEKLVLWQPAVDGAAYLSQFLRLRLVSDMLSGGKDQNSVSSLKKELVAGEMVEVAGYALTSAVSDGLSKAALKHIPHGCFPSTCWLECMASEGQESPPVTRTLLQELKVAGIDVQHAVTIGAPFWNTAEIVENHDMIIKTLGFICGDSRGA